MTLTQIFTHLNVLNAEVALCRSTYRYSADDERWACSITLENDRSELKIRSNAADGDLALVAAYEKLLPLINASQVCAAFAVPALTAPVAPADIAPQTADTDA
jgi:hypothetical protein